MLGGTSLIAFLATSDSAWTRAFYEGVLGLHLVSDDPFALVYDAQGTELRIQKVERFVPQPHTALGWSVGSIEEAVREIVARGGRFERFSSLPQDASGVWKSPFGAKVAWFKDPVAAVPYRKASTLIAGRFSRRCEQLIFVWLLNLTD